MPSVNQYTGVEAENLTEINLGSIQIKKDKQIFLSDVDPENIPADYDIKFDKTKQLSLLGNMVEGESTSEGS